MWNELKRAVLCLAVLTVLTGLVYPLLVTGVALAVFPAAARGSLLLRDGKPVGSRLIGQPFDDARYFWGRLSATSPVPYDAAASGGSNLGPTNPAQAVAAAARAARLRETNPGGADPVPVDLLTASGSGLDPDISPAAAEYQVPRVAAARGIDPERVREQVRRHTAGRTLGLLGEPRVNVLELNLALDAAAGSGSTMRR